jgi:hypothetical protein
MTNERLGSMLSMAVLALFLSPSSRAGLPCETDLDGVPCLSDNCLFVNNGPLLGACSAQEDGDMDG